MKQKHLILVVGILLCGTIFSQNSADKTINVNGKKFYRHVVKKGETIYGLSKDYSVAARDIVLENPKAMEGINPGDTLRIPYPSATPKLPDTTSDKMVGQFIYHKVIAKETQYSLAKEYKISIYTLDSLNPVLNTKGLLVGQTLKIPAHAATQQPVTQQPPVEKITPPVTPPPAPPKDTAKEKQAFKKLINQQHIDSVKKPNLQPITAPPNVIPPTAPPVAATPVDKAKLLNRYNVALIMPFTAENADTIRMNRLLDGTAQLPGLTSISTDMYQGVMIALDSLEKKGIKVNLHLYSIASTSDTSSYIIDSIIKALGFQNTNLIIGPPSTVHFKIIARYAAAHHIPIVSPLVADNDICKNNAFASKVAPASITEIEKMADYITTHYAKSNVVLLHHRDAADEVYFETFKKRFTTDMQVFAEKDSIIIADYSDNLEILGHQIKESKNNIIVVPYQGASFVSKLVNKLANSKYADNDSIVLFGMHNWLNNDNLDMADLDTLNFHFPSSDYVNYSDSTTKSFIRTYRYNYYTEPSYYAYQGFDIAYFYVGLLGKYGTALQDHLADNRYNGVHTTFEMRKVNDNGGYDNNAIYILEYRSYAVLKGAL